VPAFRVSSMKVDLKETTELERELNIEVEPETVQSALEKKLHEIRQTVTLKGFRKGKAPLDLVKSLYHDQAKADVADNLIRDTYPRAVQEKTLRVAARPTVTDLSFDDSGGFAYTVRVEVFPEVTRVECEGLTLEAIDTEPTDEEVEAMVANYRRQFSDLRPVDRPAEDGDVVLADLHKLFDSKEALVGDSFDNSEVDLGSPLTVKEFKEELPGMSAGDSKEFTVHYDEGYADSRFAGAQIRYNCTVRAVQERVLPEFDDAFAKRTGVAETALELKLKMREDIRRQKEENRTRRDKRVVVRQICEKNEIPVPEGTVNAYLDAVVEDLRQHRSEVTEEEIRQQYRQAGINSVRWDILWHALSEHESIEVSPEDSENWINGFAAANKMTPQQARQALQQSGKAAGLRESLLEDKVMAFLVGKATREPARK